jgi:hypothetical protein
MEPRLNRKPFPKWESLKINLKICQIFAGRLSALENHLMPQFHHVLTIKKPHSNTQFSQNPLQKYPPTTQKKYSDPRA